MPVYLFLEPKSIAQIAGRSDRTLFPDVQAALAEIVRVAEARLRSSGITYRVREADEGPDAREFKTDDDVRAHEVLMQAFAPERVVIVGSKHAQKTYRVRVAVAS